MISGKVPPALPNGFIQRISPAGARYETRWVLLSTTLVLVISALVVGWQRHLLPPTGMQVHQIDLATGLSAAEQGVYTDLQAAHDEWRGLGAALPPPEPKRWAADGWPPFADDLVAHQRGDRRWTLLHIGNRYAYLGVHVGTGVSVTSASAPDTEVREMTPRRLLWRLPAMQTKEGGGHDGDMADSGFDFWLHADGGESADPVAIESLDDASLIRHGWRQAVAHLHAQKRRPETHGAAAMKPGGH